MGERSSPFHLPASLRLLHWPLPLSSLLPSTLVLLLRLLNLESLVSLNDSRKVIFQRWQRLTHGSLDSSVRWLLKVSRPSLKQQRSGT